jgi:hypothetical protein
MKSALDETEPKPSRPHEIGSGAPSTQQPPPNPEPIDTGAGHRAVRDTTGSHHPDEE